MTSRLLPNWLKAYLVYTADSESPEVYHRWVGISCIAAVLRRRVFFDMGYFLLYPNMYIVLVGPAGRCKKSTAMRIGKNIFTATPDIEFSADSTTRERFIQDLQMAHKNGESAITVHSTEFASLLSSSGMDMVVFLTDIFDCPPDWQHKTKIGGTNKIVGPYLNLLGATTPDWIAKAMPLDTIGIGLTSRIVFVYADTPRVRPWRPVLSEAQNKIRDMLIHDMSLIATTQGEFQFTPEADGIYDEWYKSRLEMPNPTGDPRLNGYYERKPIHLIKLAMIVAVSHRDGTQILPSDVTEAMGIMEDAEQHMPAVFANVGKNPLSVDIEEIQKAIFSHAKEGLGIGDLMGMFKHSVRKDELVEVLDALNIMGRIVIRPVGDPPHQRMKYFPS